MVTFSKVSARRWAITVECGGAKRKLIPMVAAGVRPCMTHSSMLLEQYFPSKKRRTATTRRKLAADDPNITRLNCGFSIVGEA